VASQILITRFRSAKFFAALGCSTLVVALFFYASCNSVSSDVDTYLNHSDTVNYVGIEQCATCHQEQHSTFVHTGMGLSFDKASPNKSSAVFGKQHQVYDSLLDMHYLPYWAGDKLYIKEYRLLGEDTLHQLDVHIDYIVGSGQHTNSHLFSRNGYLYQAPITFYVQEAKWDLAPGFEKGNNTRFQRILNSECVSCHNAMPKLEGASDFKFAEIGTGIDCERCHGPGELHVKERLAGKGADVSKEIDPTIVNPRKLSWERQIDLCQRCHLQGLNVLKEGKKFTDFKPGMQLSDIFEIYLPQYEGNNSSFDMANHSARFQMSECFIQANKKELSFTCITCHNPHVSVKQTGTQVYNAACNNCHGTSKCKAPVAQLAAAKNDCVSCHMPPSGSEDIPHVSVHDHYIRVPKPASEVQEMQRLVGLYAVNNVKPELEYQIKAYLEYWEKFDKNPFYINKAAELLKGTMYNKLWLKYYYLKQEYSKATELELDEKKLTSWELFMLGYSYIRTSKMSQGVFYLEKAYAVDKTLPRIGKELLSTYFAMNKMAKAEQLALNLAKEFPVDGEVANGLARIYVMQGIDALAQQQMAKALKLAPDDLAVWSTHLNYFASKKELVSFRLWLTKIRAKNPSYLDENQIAVILDTMK
tara:strand:- start:3144 stop:5072 length:1929 start_codon:yes stop_codon:yes gene_type:complete